jgi:hypothetical protein
MATFKIDELDRRRPITKFLWRYLRGFDTVPDLRWGYVICRTNYDPEEVSDEQWKQTVEKLSGYAREEVRRESKTLRVNHDPRPNEEVAKRFEFIEIDDPQLHNATPEILRALYWRMREHFPPHILTPYAILLYIDKRCAETILSAAPPEEYKVLRDGTSPFFKVVDCSFHGAGPVPDANDFVQTGPDGQIRIVDPELTSSTADYIPEYKGWMRAELRVLWYMFSDLQSIGMARCVGFANAETGDFLYAGGAEEYLNPLQYLNESA